MFRELPDEGEILAFIFRFFYWIFEEFLILFNFKKSCSIQNIYCLLKFPQNSNFTCCNPNDENGCNVFVISFNLSIYETICCVWVYEVRALHTSCYFFSLSQLFTIFSLKHDTSLDFVKLNWHMNWIVIQFAQFFEHSLADCCQLAEIELKIAKKQ